MSKYCLLIKIMYNCFGVNTYIELMFAKNVLILMRNYIYMIKITNINTSNVKRINTHEELYLHDENEYIHRRKGKCIVI